MDHDVRELFRRAAHATPHAPAVVRGAASTTYRELEARASRWAGMLARLGVGREGVVGILTGDPATMVAGMLAVIEAGGVFCPLEPSLPERRLAAMLARATPGWVLTESPWWPTLGRLESGGRRVPHVVLVDGGAVDGDGERGVRCGDGELAGEPPAGRDPDTPCSLFFTSGSTGAPKAILGRLGSIAHFARWESEALGIGPGTRVSQLASPAFDGFLKDVFVPLINGGVACAPESRELVLQPARLADWLDVEGIEVLHCVPSVLRALLNQPLSEDYFAELRWVVLAGEVLQPADVRRFRRLFGDRIRLVNLYGPTETAIIKLCHFVEAADEERPSVPIGRPIDGAEVLLIGSRGRPCRPGMVGEIYLKTPDRALGYYGDPEATAAAFVPNPLADDPSDVVYRTGDFGRLLADGRLDFVGRRDQQVKVRGVRVELPEIENLLREQSGVLDVAVVDREDADGFTSLCAYLVLAPGVDVAALREELARHLPEPMVPTAFVALDELPRTLNGKVDRRALPALVQARAERAASLVPPRTPVEEIVAGVWSEVLHLPRVGLDESFFQLGGHSLLATQIISRIRRCLGVELPLRAFFEVPTVAAMARRVVALRAAVAGGETEPPLAPFPRPDRVPLSCSQQRMWLLEQLAAGSSAFNVPVGLRLRGPLSVATLRRTVAEVARRHEILRTSFPSRGGVPAQVIHDDVRPPLPLVDLGALPPGRRQREAARIGAAAAWRPFDLGRAPLMRLVLLRVDAEDHAVAGALHHLVGDAWSFEVLRGEISRLYGSFLAGRPSPLPRLPIQFADYALWERRRLSGPFLDNRLAYWRRQLAGAPERLALPQAGARTAVQAFRGARLPVALSAALAESLRSVGRRHGATLFMTSLTGFLALLVHTTGQEDLVVGSVSANRGRAEVEPLIGFLADTLVLRVDLSGNPSFREALDRVREVCLAAAAHALPPEKLIEGLAGERPAGDRLFDVWFQLETARREELELPGVECGSFDVGRGETRFELSLVLVEEDGGIHGEIEYDEKLFDATTVGAFRAHLLAVLEQLVADPEQPIACLSLADRSQEDSLSRAFAESIHQDDVSFSKESCT